MLKLMCLCSSYNGFPLAYLPEENINTIKSSPQSGFYLNCCLHASGQKAGAVSSAWVRSCTSHQHLVGCKDSLRSTSLGWEPCTGTSEVGWLSTCLTFLEGPLGKMAGICVSVLAFKKLLGQS